MLHIFISNLLFEWGCLTYHLSAQWKGRETDLYWCCKSKQQTVLWWFWFTTADPHGWVWSDRAELVMGSKLDVSGMFNILWHVWTSTHIHMTISFWDSYYLGWASLRYSAQVGSFIGWQMFMWICPMRGQLPFVIIMSMFDQPCA